MRLLALLLGALCAAAALAAGGERGHGFGARYPWAASLDAAWADARRAHKPLLVAITKSWCGACKALKPVFAKSDEILAASKDVVMVALEDDEEPQDDLYSPGGATYIPRFMFFSPDGRLLNLQSPSATHPYYYYDPLDIANNMKRAVDMAAYAKEVREEAREL